MTPSSTATDIPAYHHRHEPWGGRPALPRGLREEAESTMSLTSWSDLISEYSPTGGPLRLGSWECADGTDGPARRCARSPRTYRATLAIGDRIETATAAAGGPVAALTAMLYERGIGLETLEFHQRSHGDPHDPMIATFIHGTDGSRRAWAMGVSGDAGDSALRAVIACANRLLAAA
ncbi:homocitrate synthase [Mycobacterium sp. MYCO198283]|uniref:alpha-isopropylmalate synthase regulatory domain-containing protein n=1 Tax=Mycobacterium sp. MYCO198283 TaxID=2883505 RepID=UPI001E2DF8D0|nr:alpha-isopropylmalate synthase regulatory domain-containing protein [Mycobacterium sp. MYCO198283]MCG5434334.1 homocitrate synthase [Mycobacterium sp. MYCO198283]